RSTRRRRADHRRGSLPIGRRLPVSEVTPVPPEHVAGLRGYTVADLCHRWRIGSDKVLAFIRKGELVAVNVAANLSGRPQWRVSEEEVRRFETRRSSAPTPKPARRRRQTGLVDYFPGD